MDLLEYNLLLGNETSAEFSDTYPSKIENKRKKFLYVVINKNVNYPVNFEYKILSEIENSGNFKKMPSDNEINSFITLRILKYSYK